MPCKPFLQQSRRKRKHAFITVKNNNQRYKNILGGSFYTYDYINSSTQWADFCFLGKTNVIYNAVISTVNGDLYGQLFDVVTEEEFAHLFRVTRQDIVGDVQCNISTTSLSSELELQEDRHKWFVENFDELLARVEHRVTVETSIHYDYSFGIGVHARVDAPNITIQLIQDFITNFKEENHCGPPLLLTKERLHPPNNSIQVNNIVTIEEWEKIIRLEKEYTTVQNNTDVET